MINKKIAMPVLVLGLALLVGCASTSLNTQNKALEKPLNAQGHTIGILLEPQPAVLDVQYEARSSFGLSMMATAGGATNDIETRDKLNKVVDSQAVQKEFYNTMTKKINRATAPKVYNENLYFSAYPPKYKDRVISGIKTKDFSDVMKEKHLEYLLHVRYTAGMGTMGGPLAKPTAFVDGRFYLYKKDGTLLASERYNTRQDVNRPLDPNSVITDPKKFREDLRFAMATFSQTVCERIRLNCK